MISKAWKKIAISNCHSDNWSFDTLIPGFDLRLFFYFLLWEITTKPPCGRICFIFFQASQADPRIRVWVVFRNPQMTMRFHWLHFHLPIFPFQVACSSLQVCCHGEKAPQGPWGSKKVSPREQWLETVGCDYAWCVEDSNWKQKATNTIFFTPSHLRMEGPEWNL